jgi:hypothetical protein
MTLSINQSILFPYHTDEKQLTPTLKFNGSIEQYQYLLLFSYGLFRRIHFLNNLRPPNTAS